MNLFSSLIVYSMDGLYLKWRWRFMWTIFIDSVSWVILAAVCLTLAVGIYRLSERIKRGV